MPLLPKNLSFWVFLISFFSTPFLFSSPGFTHFAPQLTPSFQARILVFLYLSLCVFFLPALTLCSFHIQVFSAFELVHKITTFEKTTGFQALVQFSDAETASSANAALDGRSIPRYLIPELGPCTLRITFSAHTDLSVKFQSQRSRDYTNPLLPVAPSAIDASGQLQLVAGIW